MRTIYLIIPCFLFASLNKIACRRKHEGKLLDIGLGNVFLGLTAETQAAKAKIHKWDCIKQKSFYRAKETIKK